MATRRFFYIGADNKGLPRDWLGFVVARDLAVIALRVMVGIEIYRPHPRPGPCPWRRRPGRSVLDAAPDRFTICRGRRVEH